MAVTLAQIITEAKELIDESGSNFVDDTQWAIWANMGARKLARAIGRINASLCLVRATGLVIASSDAAPGTNSITIPAAAVGVYAVERDPTSTTLRRFVRQINPMSKNARCGELGYWRDATKVYIEPAEQSAGSYAIYYYAGATTMTSGVNLDTFLEPWWEYVAMFAAIRAQAKDKLDTSELERRLMMFEQDELEPQAARAGGILGAGIIDTEDLYASDNRWY